MDYLQSDWVRLISAEQTGDQIRVEPTMGAFDWVEMAGFFAWQLAVEFTSSPCFTLSNQTKRC